MSKYETKQLKKLKRKLKKLESTFVKQTVNKVETELYCDITDTFVSKCKVNERHKELDGLDKYIYLPNNVDDVEEINNNTGKVYTIIQEDGDMFAVKGLRFVNRYGCLILI